MRRAWPAALIVVVALAGCTQSVNTPQSPPSLTSPESNRTQIPPGYLDDNPSEPEMPPGYLDDNPSEPEIPQATWDEKGRASAIAAGETAMKVFARPGLDYETWWDELSPLMTDLARSDYANVDPQNVRVREVTGAGKLIDEGSAFIAYVEVPTNVGVYVVTLSRGGNNSPWLISRYLPPDSAKKNG